MAFLEQFRSSPRWLILLLGLATLVVTTVALMPHDDNIGEDVDCLVCKAGQKPPTEPSTRLVVEPPLAQISRAPVCPVQRCWTPIIESGSPRAPPV